LVIALVSVSVQVVSVAFNSVRVFARLLFSLHVHLSKNLHSHISGTYHVVLMYKVHERETVKGSLDDCGDDGEPGRPCVLGIVSLIKYICLEGEVVGGYGCCTLFHEH
jgi:hypothetical protein